MTQARTISRLLSGLAVGSTGVAVTVLLFPDPLADVFFAGIVSLSVLFALVSAFGAWTNRPSLVWAGALLLTGLSILGMLSIGVALLPAAVLSLGAAGLAQLAGPDPAVREAIVADPPTERELARRKAAATGAVVLGIVLVYVGAFTRELFGACASETVACALETTNWGAVGLTLLGLLAVSVGGWVRWKQAYITRVLASTRTR